MIFLAWQDVMLRLAAGLGWNQTAAKVRATHIECQTLRDAGISRGISLSSTNHVAELVPVDL